MHLKYLPVIVFAALSAWSCSGSESVDGDLSTGGAAGSATGGSGGSATGGSGGATGGSGGTGGVRTGGTGGVSTGGTGGTGGAATGGAGGSGGAGAGTGGNGGTATGGSAGVGGGAGAGGRDGGGTAGGGVGGGRVDAGAEAGPRPEGGTTGMLSYMQNIEPIMTQRCVGCHGNGGGLRISYATLVTTGPVTAARANCTFLDTSKRRVVPGNAANSFLWIKISRTSAELMGAGCGQHMPEGNAMLTQAQLDTIQNWILQGANP